MREHRQADAGGSADHRPVLIVNADDFGLTSQICAGVLHAHEHGIVTSTSALAIAPAFDAYAPSLRDSGLSVGGHLAAVGEDRPLLSRREVPSLVDGRGAFPLTWQHFLRRAATGRVDPDDLRREFTAQMEKLRAAGLVLTHLDSHQNLHLWPQVATVVLELARHYGIGAIRVSRSRRWTPIGVGVRALSARLRARAAAAGVAYPAASTGFDESVSLEPSTLAGAIRRLAATGAPTAELVTHLGFDPDPDRVRYPTRFDWSAELTAMCDPLVAAAVDRAGFRLGSFASLDDPSAQPRAAVSTTRGLITS